jgi:hypothetical protein
MKVLSRHEYSVNSGERIDIEAVAVNVGAESITVVLDGEALRPTSSHQSIFSFIATKPEGETHVCLIAAAFPKAVGADARYDFTVAGSSGDQGSFSLSAQAQLHEATLLFHVFEDLDFASGGEYNVDPPIIIDGEGSGDGGSGITPRRPWD